MTDALKFRARFPLRSHAVTLQVLVLGITLVKWAVDGDRWFPWEPLIVGVVLGVLLSATLAAVLVFTPLMGTAVGPTHVLVKNLYGFSSWLPWEAIKSVHALELPWWTYIGELVFVRSGRVTYVMGKRYTDNVGFLRALDKFAPAGHPLRRHYLSTERS